LFREFLNPQTERENRAAGGRSEDPPQPYHLYVLIPQFMPTSGRCHRNSVARVSSKIRTAE
jgi:hypothetical protein